MRDSVDPAYLESGSVRFESGAPTSSDAVDDDDDADYDGHRRPNNEEYAQQRGTEANHDEKKGDDSAEDGQAKEVVEDKTGEAIPDVLPSGGDNPDIDANSASGDGDDDGTPSGAEESGSDGPPIERVVILQVAGQQSSSTTSSSSPCSGISGDGKGDGNGYGKRGAGVRPFTFATELFFLTHRALEVIVSSMRRRATEAGRIVNQNALNHTGTSTAEDIDDDAAAGAAVGASVDGTNSGAVSELSWYQKRMMYKEMSNAMYYGWAVEGLGSEAVLGLAVKFANFTSSWLEHQLARHHLDDSRGTLNEKRGGDGVPAGATGKVVGVFERIPSALIETTCDSWISAVRRDLHGRFLSNREAANAARFCGRVMEVGGLVEAMLSSTRRYWFSERFTTFFTTTYHNVLKRFTTFHIFS